MLDEYRLDAVADAVAEVDSGMVDIAVVLGTSVSIVPNEILDELEGYEAKYFALRKVLDRLDAYTRQELTPLRLGNVPSRATIDAYRTYRESVICILKGEEPKQ